MKNYIVAVLLSLCVVATAFARPALIGHRGSYWGVENSAEAFIAGAEAGYQYLETDVKVAGDGTFILIHDDDTERLGGNLDILSATIDELKAEARRNGIKPVKGLKALEHTENEEYRKVSVERLTMRRRLQRTALGLPACFRR